jgi:hypothetical protein
MLNIAGLKLPMIGDKLVGGNVYFVDSGATNANTGNVGLHPTNSPMSTLASAISLCENDRGDFVVLLPGHAETPTSTITLNKSDVTIVGIGNGKNRPKFTFTMASSADNFNVTADDVTIDNVYLAASGAAQTAKINVAAANFTLKNSLLEQGANDLAGLTIAQAGEDCAILNNEFEITANGPDHAIKVETSGSDGLRVIGNLFNGMSQVNGWDTGCIYSATQNIHVVITDNVMMFVTGNAGLIQFTAAVTGIIARNILGEGTIAQMLDPGSCMCYENWEADAIDQTARKFPTTAAS